MESWLIAWARWRACHEPAASADAGATGAYEEVDSAIASLPAPLRETVEECYLGRGDLAAHASRLGCPPWTLNRRLSRAHRLLHGTLLERRERARDAGLVSALRRRLSSTPEDPAV